MSSLLKKPEKTSVCSMIPKAGMLSTESKLKRPLTNSAESRKFLLARTLSHHSSPTTVGPSDTPTPTAKSVTPSKSTSSGKITNWVKFDTGNACQIIGGRNLGRIGTIQSRVRHPGGFDIVNVKDAMGHSFATRLSNIFIIGQGNKPMVSLPRDKG